MRIGLRIGAAQKLDQNTDELGDNLVIGVASDHFEVKNPASGGRTSASVSELESTCG